MICDVCAYGHVLVEGAHGCQCMCTEVPLLGVTFCLARLARLFAGIVSRAKRPWASMGSFICPTHVSFSACLLRIWTQGSDWPGKRFTHWVISWVQSKLWDKLQERIDHALTLIFKTDNAKEGTAQEPGELGVLKGTLRRLLFSRCCPQDFSYTL